MMSPGSWYSLLTMRILGSVGLAALLMWFIYGSAIPGWAKVMLDILLVSGLVVSVSMPPWTYGQYQANRRRLDAALEKRDDR